LKKVARSGGGTLPKGGKKGHKKREIKEPKGVFGKYRDGKRVLGPERETHYFLYTGPRLTKAAPIMRIKKVKGASESRELDWPMDTI